MRIALAALAALLVAPPAPGADVRAGPSPEVAGVNAERGPEVFRIRVVNRGGGPIAVSRDGGETWLSVGSVVSPATAVNPKGYTASMWADASAIAAAAVNAIHVKVANDPETDRGVIFSVIPAGETVGAAQDRERTSIATDIPPGDGIFGGGLSPYVNSPVYLAREGLTPLAPDWSPSEGDVLVIRVTEPPRRIQWLDLQNRFGGLIRARFIDGEDRTIGSVLRPVVGIGRFEGTRHAAPGRIRANHPGVVDISTSPIGLVGGFQIVPSGHAGSPETTYIRTGTQWMVVGPIATTEPSWEGVAPLFAGCLRPSYRPDDIQHDDWMRRLLSRCQVQVRFDGGPWELMPRIAIDPAASDHTDNRNHGRDGLWRIPGSLQPYTPLPGIANTALRGVSHIRIILPRADYWPEPIEGDLW